MPDDLYGYVENEEVKDGPRTLPTSWRAGDVEILAFDQIADPAPYGWWPWVEQAAPEFDPATQRLESGTTLSTRPKQVLRSYSVVPLSPEELAALDPVPEEISTRQFFQQLAKDGDCTEDEALAYVQTGALPEKLLAVIKTLPAGMQFDVKMELIGANDFIRSQPTVDIVGWLMGKDRAALDRIWRLAVKL